MPMTIITIHPGADPVADVAKLFGWAVALAATQLALGAVVAVYAPGLASATALLGGAVLLALMVANLHLIRRAVDDYARLQSRAARATPLRGRVISGKATTIALAGGGLVLLTLLVIAGTIGLRCAQVIAPPIHHF